MTVKERRYVNLKKDDLYRKSGGCSLALLPQIDEVWSDITAPFAKVGAILWENVKTILKEVPEFEWSQMVSRTPPESSWKPGCLNDEVNRIAIMQNASKPLAMCLSTVDFFKQVIAAYSKNIEERANKKCEHYFSLCIARNTLKII